MHFFIAIDRSNRIYSPEGPRIHSRHVPRHISNLHPGSTHHASRPDTLRARNRTSPTTQNTARTHSATTTSRTVSTEYQNSIKQHPKTTRKQSQTQEATEKTGPDPKPENIEGGSRHTATRTPTTNLNQRRKTRTRKKTTSTGKPRWFR